MALCSPAIRQALPWQPHARARAPRRLGQGLWSGCVLGAVARRAGSILGILKPDLEEDLEDLEEDWSFEELEKKTEEAREQHQRALSQGRQAGHEPVLLVPVLQWLFPPEYLSTEDELSIRAGDARYRGLYVDCTFGRGGYSREILARLDEEDGHLLALDIDPSCRALGRVLEQQDDRFTFRSRPFSELAEVLQDPELAKLGPPAAVVMDVGICSVQIDDRRRGFSLQNLEKYPDTDLDLRMNSDEGRSASEWLADASVEELAWVLREYGPDDQDCFWAERMAEAIQTDQEQHGPFESMNRFAALVGREMMVGQERFAHTASGRAHPARLTVQAIRIFLNSEIEQLRKGLFSALEVLAMGGRCVVTTFKRKEAKVVAQFLGQMEDPVPAKVDGLKKRRLVELYPLAGTDLDYAVKLLAMPMRPAVGEVAQNSRARSGTIYIMEKVRRTCPRVKVKPRRLPNRFKQPEPNPI